MHIQYVCCCLRGGTYYRKLDFFSGMYLGQWVNEGVWKATALLPSKWMAALYVWWCWICFKKASKTFIKHTLMLPSEAL